VSSSDQPSDTASAVTQTAWLGIVDDDPSILCSLARLFRSQGIRVGTFCSAEEYLLHSMPSEPHCIVLDVHLGKLSGFDLQDRLAARGATPAIIYITARDEIPFARRSSGVGKAGYLRKPLDTDTLLALVRWYLYGEIAERAP
jgi:two-component system, LuxR family, response regulator FixJ